MNKRYFLLFVGFILFVAVAAPPVQAGEWDGDHHHGRRNKEVRVDWRFAGTFINNIMEFDLVANEVTPTALIHGQLKGSPGSAELRVFAGKTEGPVFSPDCYNGAPGLMLTIVENPIVITFPDLSLLFAKLAEGAVGDFCLEIDPGTGMPTGMSEGKIPIMFTGGRGRFEGASGEAMIEGETEAVSSNLNFSGETATVKGWVILPHGHGHD